ncbi:putative caspase [Diaporthe sp. PMI_573]|nr:putative caspase [Diaporthaceae sp. PMI_573]
MDPYQSADFTHYAILIGINAYPSSPLKSCVRDAQNTKNYLEGKLKSVHVRIFTATESPDLMSRGPIEPPARWPTFSNVRASLMAITSSAKAGDFLYIHYSGHGIRGQPYGTFSNRSTGDLALVLLDGEEADSERYLWGPELASLLKALVDKDVVVTLVLDCCFSASVYRNDDNSDIRSLPYDLEVDLRHPLSRQNSLGGDLAGNRDASMLPNWLIDPDGYAILAACGPHEVAKGIKDQDGQRHGALSYYLLESLRTCGGVGKRLDAIHRRLCAIFRDSWKQQNPVLFGNKRQGFFGPVSLETDDTLISIVDSGGYLQLQAGQAHGVCDGDRFEICSTISGPREDDSALDGGQVIGRATRVGALTSVLEILRSPSIAVQTGWVAKPLFQRSLRSFPVQLALGSINPDDGLAAMRNQSLYVRTDQGTGGPPPSFHVTSNSLGEFEILDQYCQRITSLRTWQQDQTHIGRVWDVVEHLVRYSMVRELGGETANVPFRLSFDIQITKASADSVSPNCVTDVKHNDRLELTVTNKGNDRLYLYIFDMGPYWQVENILRGGYEVIPPTQREEGFEGTCRKKLKMVVPSKIRERGQRWCEDIIKVFVTSQPTSFDLLELPVLGRSAKKKASGGRIPEGTNCSAEAWVAFNFCFHISLE